MKRFILTTITGILIMAGNSLAAETQQQTLQSSIMAQEMAKNRQYIQQQIQQQMQPQIQQQKQQVMQMQSQSATPPIANALTPAGLGAVPRYQIAANLMGNVPPFMMMQSSMPGLAMPRYGMPFNPMAGQMPPAFIGGGMGQGFGMGARIGPRFGMGAGAGPLSAMSAGGGIIPGLGMSFGPGTGLEIPEDVQKFLDETQKLRRELHAMKFDYFEAARNKKTSPEDLAKLENDMVELRSKIFQRATGQN